MHSKGLFSTTVRLQLLLARTLHLQAYKTVKQLFNEDTWKSSDTW